MFSLTIDSPPSLSFFFLPMIKNIRPNVRLGQSKNKNVWNAVMKSCILARQKKTRAETWHRWAGPWGSTAGGRLKRQCAKAICGRRWSWVQWTDLFTLSSSSYTHITCFLRYNVPCLQIQCVRKLWLSEETQHRISTVFNWKLRAQLKSLMGSRILTNIWCSACKSWQMGVGGGALPFNHAITMTNHVMYVLIPNTIVTISLCNSYRTYTKTK